MRAIHVSGIGEPRPQSRYDVVIWVSSCEAIRRDEHVLWMVIGIVESKDDVGFQNKLGILRIRLVIGRAQWVAHLMKSDGLVLTSK